MRLIDADLLLQKRFEDGMIDGNELLVPYNDVVNAIRQAPTVEGYRKSSEVAEEIFGEIDRMCIDTFGNFNHRVFAELKKKYTEGEK